MKAVSGSLEVCNDTSIHDGVSVAVCPDIKTLITGEAIAINRKFEASQQTLNSHDPSMCDTTGKDHGAGPGVVVVCTNFGDKIGLEKEGYQRRFSVRRNNFVPSVADPSIEENASVSMHWEIPYCLHAWGKIRQVMETEGSHFRDLFPDENGHGLLRRQSEEYFQDLRRSCDNDQHIDWIDTHLKNEPGRWCAFKKVFAKYTDDISANGQAPLESEKFLDLCTKVKHFVFMNAKTGSPRVCATCYNEDTMSYKKFSTTCSCALPVGKQKQSLLKDCVYVAS